MELEEEEALILRVVAFERGTLGNPTRKEGKALFRVEVEGESERNEDEEEEIVEIEVKTILLLLCYDAGTERE